MTRALVAVGMAAALSAPAAADLDAAHAPAPGSVLRSFVAAAGRSDARAAWRLLTPAAQRRVGPFAAFRTHTAIELEEGAGTYARARGLRTALSVEVGGGWAVAAVSGTRRVEGTRE